MLRAKSQDWKFALTDDGSLLAVLQTQLLEIYTAKDTFNMALGESKYVIQVRVQFY